jgi:hypothetical protein
MKTMFFEEMIWEPVHCQRLTAASSDRMANFPQRSHLALLFALLAVDSLFFWKESAGCSNERLQSERRAKNNASRRETNRFLDPSPSSEIKECSGEADQPTLSCWQAFSKCLRCVKCSCSNQVVAVDSGCLPVLPILGSHFGNSTTACLLALGGEGGGVTFNFLANTRRTFQFVRQRRPSPFW